MTAGSASSPSAPVPLHPPAGPSSSDGSAAQTITSSLCAFWLGEKAYAVETAIVGEVLNVETFIPVPVTHPAILGLFSLRGTPTSLVDLAAVLQLPGVERADSKARTALALRKGNVLLTGVLIDRMERVLQPGQGIFVARDASDEDPVVRGFVEVEARKDLTLTLLDSGVLFERLERLKFL